MIIGERSWERKREMTERVDEGEMVDGITVSGRVRSLV